MRHPTTDSCRALYAQAHSHLSRARNELHPEARLAFKSAGIQAFRLAEAVLDRVPDPIDYLQLVSQSERLVRSYLLPEP